MSGVQINDLQLKDGFHYGLRGAMMVLALVLGMAGPAAAGNVLFQYKFETCSLLFPDCGGRVEKVTGTVSGQTLMTTITPNGVAEFTVPSKIFSRTGTFSATYLPVYPYFKGTYTRYNKGGSIMVGNANWSPGAVLTFSDRDTQYPYATTPANGFIRANVGPNGLAGPNSFLIFTYYTLTVVSGGAVFQGTFLVQATGGGPLSTNPDRNGRSVVTNTSNGSQNGVVVWGEPDIWNFTGTLTVSQPPPRGPTWYFVRTAMDNRTVTAGGASGTIQLITANLSHNYTVTPLPAPMDGSATVVSYQSGFGTARITTLDMIPTPEPGQIALIGLGVAGLAGIWGMRRRG